MKQPKRFQRELRRRAPANGCGHLLGWQPLLGPVFAQSSTLAPWAGVRRMALVGGAGGPTVHRALGEIE
jgi:hypothetical protein